MAGTVTSAGVFVPIGGSSRRLPATGETLRDWIERAAASGELQPCPHCGTWYGCDCVDWLEWTAMLDADPHGDLSEWQDCDLPY